ncbi:MAG TPA: hypothetical protein VJ180_11840, partial [Pyrinomonadaceae bacterium]|nr:hypothetical protein [Pyrinomonadaceae bacterium]
RLMEFISVRGVLLGALLFVITFSLSLAIVTVILVKIPANYFKADYPRDLWRNRHKAIRITGVVGKNLIGAFLVVLGVVMSLPGVPGQGVLTILLGVMLLDFPGKRQLEFRLISRPNVLRTVNRVRERFGKAPLVME